MVSVNIRQLTHHFASYLKEVKAGQRIIIMERDTPVAEIIPHNENIIRPGWKRNIAKVKIQGEALSQTISNDRREENG
jgi:antitoxin (DNA-binding transcriptional repressor) of toxin-antitoxin stability system